MSTAAVAGGSIVLATMSINTISSMMSASSSQSIFASINQLQLIVLLVLYGVYLPGKVLNLIQSFNMSLLSLDIPSLPLFRSMSWFFIQFNYSQDNENLQIVGLSSGSTLINIMTPFFTALALVMLHILVGLASLLYRRSGPRNF